MDSRHAFTEIGRKGIWRGYETLCLLSGKNREAHPGRGQLTCRTCSSDHRSLVGLTIVPIFSDKLVGQEMAEQIEKIRAIPVVLIEIHDSTVCVCVCVCVCTHALRRVQFCNGMVCIKKRCQEYTEELYKKELHDPGNQDGVVTHLEPDILECEVKWAWGSITMNKASGGDGIPVELFPILKDDAEKVLHSICQQIWKTQKWPQDWKRLAFIPIPNKGNAREGSNYCTIALISHASKVMVKPGFKSKWTVNFHMFKLDLEKAEEPEIKLPTSTGSAKKQESSRKSSISALLTMPKPLTVWITINCGKFWKRWEYQTCLLRNLYSGKEATVRTGHGTIDWFQIGKGVHQGCILSPCLFNLYAEYIMQNARLDEAQAGIKIARRNINNLRYADDTTLMVESKKELKSLLIKWK